MRIENQFEVRARVEELWMYLLDVERVAPCMPGAELTETIDDHTWKGLVKMKFGPVALDFAGTVTMDDRDDATHRVVLKAQGQERRGKGAAHAEVMSWLEPGDGVTTVKMQADITLTGAVAQLSRGLLPEISAKLTQQFADCLHANMAMAERVEEAAPTEAAAPAPIVAKPVGGIRLGLSALWAMIQRFFSRLFGGKSSS